MNYLLLWLFDHAIKLVFLALKNLQNPVKPLNLSQRVANFLFIFW